MSSFFSFSLCPFSLSLFHLALFHSAFFTWSFFAQSFFTQSFFTQSFFTQFFFTQSFFTCLSNSFLTPPFNQSTAMSPVFHYLQKSYSKSKGNKFSCNFSIFEIKMKKDKIYLSHTFCQKCSEVQDLISFMIFIVDSSIKIIPLIILSF